MKYSDNFHNTEIEGSMWHSEEFAEFLREMVGEDVWENKIKPQIKKIVKYSLECVQDMIESKKGCSEIYGYDFMIDEDLVPWLIEINRSPAMDYSTEVTKVLVKEVLEDTIKVIVDYEHATKRQRNSIDTGNFSLLYRAKHAVQRPMEALGCNLLLEGKSIK